MNLYYLTITDGIAFGYHSLMNTPKNHAKLLKRLNGLF